MKTRRLFALATASTLLLAGCGLDPAGQITENVGTMGNAEPAASPAETEPAGEVVEFEPIQDIDLTNGTLGVRAGSQLVTGTLDEVTNGSAEATAIDENAADISANDGTFAVARPNSNEVELITAGSAHALVPVNEDVTVAAPLAGGGIIAGSATTERIWIYAEDGTELDTFKVARPSDYVLAQSLADNDARAVRVNRFDTTIQDLHAEKGRAGGTLRVGLGVGKIAFGEDGLVLAADATGNRMLVYTTDEVIRLHQMVPTDGSPWDVAWDSKRGLAWVASTETNTVTGYDLSQGVPLEKKKLNTVADPQSLVALDDGTLVIGSASGGGLQIIDPDTTN